MLRVVTVIGHGIEILPHFLNHYKFADEINIVVYESNPSLDLENEIRSQIKFHKNVKIVDVIHGTAFDWNKVTDLYNIVKSKYPDDWWIVADIDELQIYPNGDPFNVIKQCDKNGWKLVRGGFIDRVGIRGNFPIIESNKSIFAQFPMMGFFRYPLSNACPNKICIMKGDIELTPGQHYAMIDGHTTWKWQGWNHPLIAPYEKYSVQVHHFKWDSTCLDRIKEVADIKQEYAFSDEYQKMYDAIKDNKFKIDIRNKEFMFEMSEVTDCTFETYSQWNKLIKKIVLI